MAKNKWIFITVFIGLILFLTYFTKPAPATELNTPAPEFSLIQVDTHKTIQLKDSQGKLRLLVFWATWCAPCRAEIPSLIEMQNKYVNKLQILGISVDEDISAVRRMQEGTPFNYPIVQATEQLIQDYGGIRTIPTVFVVDQQGIMKEVILQPMSESALENLIQKHLQ